MRLIAINHFTALIAVLFSSKKIYRQILNLRLAFLELIFRYSSTQIKFLVALLVLSPFNQLLILAFLFASCLG